MPYTMGPLRISLRHKAPNFRFICYSLTHQCFSSKPRVVAISCILGPISIMSLMQWNSVISCRKERWSRFWRNKLWRRTEELIYPWVRTVMVYYWPCQLKANCFWWAFWTGLEKKVFSRSTAAYQVQEDVLICSSNETTYSSFNRSYHLDKFMIIHCYSPGSIYFLHRPHKKVEWGCANHHTSIFQDSDGGTNLCNPSRDVLLFLIYCFPRQRQL